MPLAHVVEQPAGRRDQQVQPAAQAAGLRLHADAPEDDGAAQAQVRPVLLGHLSYLRRQLSGRGDDERARAPCRRPAGEPVQDREEKGGGLAGAGLGAGDEVPPLQRHGDAAFLYRGGGGVAGAANGANEFRAQAQFGELHLYRCS